ncbi:MAG: cysteine--tRNA ligase [Aliifodinibius sp.]|nr:cysteine--tRNA ligase [Fodinibius sp.]NIY29867.1 cysteine--tRNA ligase [Fodinibius sp.]
MNELRLYNSLSRKVEAFEPQGETVTIYVCGITPYDTTHLGHIFTYAAADVLIRYLEYQGCEIKYAQNLTDVDDPLFRKAEQEYEDWRELGQRWTLHFIDDMKTLNIRAPDYYPQATEVIQEMIAIVQDLLQAGVAYESGGSVYFNIDACPEFGKLSQIARADMLPIANERGNNPDDPNKRDPLDFDLWRARKPGEPAWESPWGPGRPGWHIECSTMAKRFLGETIDIHGGGSDLIFPHHESEIAQSECATHQQPFVRHWFHTAMVRQEGKKMSKSIGNLIMVRDLLKDVSPDGLRLYLGQQHYREPWEFNAEGLQESESLAQKLRSAATAAGGLLSAPRVEVEEIRSDFISAMNDDLSSPAAVKQLDDLASLILQAAEVDKNVRGAQRLLSELSSIFGLRLHATAPDERVLSQWDEHAQKFTEVGDEQDA